MHVESCLGERPGKLGQGEPRMEEADFILPSWGELMPERHRQAIMKQQEWQVCGNIAQLSDARVCVCVFFFSTGCEMESSMHSMHMLRRCQLLWDRYKLKAMQPSHSSRQVL
jgi:hypothetical protein